MRCWHSTTELRLHLNCRLLLQWRPGAGRSRLGQPSLKTHSGSSTSNPPPGGFPETIFEWAAAVVPTPHGPLSLVPYCPAGEYLTTSSTSSACLASDPPAYKALSGPHETRGGAERRRG